MPTVIYPVSIPPPPLHAFQSMGRDILHTLGCVYQNYARRSLGKLAPGVLEPETIRGKIKFYSDQAHRVNNLLAAVSSTTRLYAHLQMRYRDARLKYKLCSCVGIASGVCVLAWVRRYIVACVCVCVYT